MLIHMHASPSLPGPLLPRHVRIGHARLDLASHELRYADGAVLRLSPKASGVLRVLLESADRPVHREELLARVWAGRIRTDDVITKAIYELRKALGGPGGTPVIENVPRVGYRLVMPWQPMLDAHPQAAGDDPVPPAHGTQQIERASVEAPYAAGRGEPRRLPWRGWPALGGGLVVLSLAVLPVAWWMGSQLRIEVREHASTVPPAVRVRPLSGDPEDEGSAAPAPDGRWIVVSQSGAQPGTTRLLLRSLDGTQVRELTRSSAAGDPLLPQFSPDGMQVAYERARAGNCQIELAPLAGGVPRVLTSCVPGVSAALEFFPDSQALLLPRVGSPLPGKRHTFERLDIDSGQRTDWDYPSAPEDRDVEGRFSPDGRWLLVRRGVAPRGVLWLIDLRQRSSRRLRPWPGAVHGMTWLRDNRHVVLASDAAGPMQLWRLDTRDASATAWAELSGQFPRAARHADLLVYRHANASRQVLAMPLDGLHPAIRVLASARSEWEPVLAPDGHRLAFVSDRTGTAQVYLTELATEAVLPITRHAEGAPRELSWSPDGQHLLFRLRTLTGAAWKSFDLARRNTRRLGGWSDTVEDLRHAAAENEFLYVRRGADHLPHLYLGRANDDASALLSERRLTVCPGHAPQIVSPGWVYFLAPDDQGLWRAAVDPAGQPAACDLLSPHIRWWNRHAWGIAAEGGLVAYLGPPFDVQGGIFDLSPNQPPRKRFTLSNEARFVESGARFSFGSGTFYSAVATQQNGDILVLTPTR